ncbi:MAG: sodium:solute symporter family protein [Bryobacterales bacterium]|nr:sodium:solute symporter family protein [Bryobacterales bacterium]
MIPTIFVFLYLGVVLYIGIFAFRRGGKGDAEDYFVAGRSLGQFVFLLSLFGTNMTAFAILGASGHAFANGIVTFGLMASSSALLNPLSILLLGTRIWALGKEYGFLTPVQMFRDRWECGHIGTAIFVLQAGLLVPYIIIGVMGGGTVLATVSGGLVPYWFGAALVALVVMSYVFFGGMRGTAWVNTLQTVLFLSFGAIAVAVIGSKMGGFPANIAAMRADEHLAPLLTRERISPLFFLSYMFVPLSTMALPHMSIFCLTARKMAQFRRTVILYPLCILAIWLPCVYLGVIANKATEIPEIQAKRDARAALISGGASLSEEERARLRAQAGGDDVMILMLDQYAPVWLAGLLGAGIMAAVMASDSQILALSTMFTEDVFTYYGGKERFGEAVQIYTGRVFIVGVTIVAYIVALHAPPRIFDLAVQYALSGFAAMLPLLVAALFWRGSTKWGALAVTLWTTGAVTAIAVLQYVVPSPTGPPAPLWTVAGVDVISRTAGGTAVFGFLPVVPMTLISALLMWTVSLATPKPSAATIHRYFRPRGIAQ